MLARSRRRHEHWTNFGWTLHLLRQFNHIFLTENLLKVRSSYLLQVELQWFLAFRWGHLTLAKKSGFIATKLEFPCARLRHKPWKFFVFRFMDIPHHSRMPVSTLTNKEPMNFNPSLIAAKTWTGPMIIGGDFNWPLKDLSAWTLLQHNGWTESRDFSLKPIGE